MQANHRSQGSQDKKTWDMPTLIVHGSLAEITKFNKVGTQHDQYTAVIPGLAGSIVPNKP
jgi:hypothetical protein